MPKMALQKLSSSKRGLFGFGRDAWNRLGKMTKEEAMAAYIEEMKKSAKKVGNGNCCIRSGLMGGWAGLS